MRICMLFVGMFLLGFGQANATEKPVQHTVRSGEFLVRIATEYPGVSWRAIAKANNIKSPYIIHAKQKLIIPAPKKSARVALAPQTTLASATATQILPLPVASEVILTTDGAAHVFVGKVRNRITPEEAVPLLFGDVALSHRERLLAQITAGVYTPILLPVGYRVSFMLTADGTRHENVLIAPMTDVPLLGMCYALPLGDSSALLLIHEVRSWNWYREIIPIGQVADCLRQRTGLRERDIAPPSVVRGDEALMPYVAIPRSQAR